MFDRKSIKEFARFRLSQRRWVVVIVLVIAGLLGAAVATPSLPGFNFSVSGPMDGIFSQEDDTTDADSGTVWDDALPGGWEETTPEETDPDAADPGIWDDADDYDPNPDNWFDKQLNGWGEGARTVVAFAIIFVIVFLIVFVLALLKTIFLGNIVTVGMNGWLLRFWRGEDVRVTDLFACFRIYKPSLKAMLVRDIYFILWNLLPVVGIIKSYAYSMVPYIIYENPNLTPNQAIALSQKLTRGYKWKLFVLELSFIGWNLLSALTFGILGLLYVNPYMGLTCAGAYEQLKWAALQEGRVDWSDFGQLPPAEVWDTPAEQEPIVCDPQPPVEASVDDLPPVIE